MEMWWHMTAFKLLTTLRIDSDSNTLRPQLDAIRIKYTLFVVNLPWCGSTFPFRLLASHPKEKYLMLNEQTSTGPTLVEMEARRVFSA